MAVLIARRGGNGLLKAHFFPHALRINVRKKRGVLITGSLTPGGGITTPGTSCGSFFGSIISVVMTTSVMGGRWIAVRAINTRIDRRAARLGERSVNLRLLPPLVDARAVPPVWRQVCACAV
jgi:hypothetical protein